MICTFATSTASFFSHLRNITSATLLMPGTPIFLPTKSAPRLTWNFVLVTRLMVSLPSRMRVPPAIATSSMPFSTAGRKAVAVSAPICIVSATSAAGMLSGNRYAGELRIDPVGGEAAVLLGDEGRQVIRRRRVADVDLDVDGRSAGCEQAQCAKGR